MRSFKSNETFIRRKVGLFPILRVPGALIFILFLIEILYANNENPDHTSRS